MKISITDLPVIYGEVLFDLFEDDTSVMGGAPFNVAWHLHGLGMSPMFISRIGEDRLGEKILASMEEWRMHTEGIQHDDIHPTGTVSVKLSSGQPEFNIVPDVAYDYIEYSSVISAIPKSASSIFYHGSLIARTEQSMQTLKKLRNETNSRIFTDINLRPDCWTPENINVLLKGIHWLKINDQELEIIARSFGWQVDSLELMAQNLQERFGMEAIIVTLGEKGAFCIDESRATHHVEPVSVECLVDTVGAGDAFSAITITGLLQGWDFKQILQRAVIFAAAVCEQRGAIIQDTEFYKKYRQDWKL